MVICFAKKKICKNKNGHNVYLMRCTKCNRVKEMKDYVIKSSKGIYHKSCGKGIKTKNKTFYNRWKSMRTRTNNDNYWGTKYYKQKVLTVMHLNYL